jgi:hypothetical protein
LPPDTSIADVCRHRCLRHRHTSWDSPFGRCHRRQHHHPRSYRHLARWLSTVIQAAERIVSWIRALYRRRDLFRFGRSGRLGFPDIKVRAAASNVVNRRKSHLKPSYFRYRSGINQMDYSLFRIFLTGPQALVSTLCNGEIVPSFSAVAVGSWYICSRPRNVFQAS